MSGYRPAVQERDVRAMSVRSSASAALHCRAASCTGLDGTAAGVGRGDEGTRGRWDSGQWAVGSGIVCCHWRPGRTTISCTVLLLLNDTSLCTPSSILRPPCYMLHATSYMLHTGPSPGDRQQLLVLHRRHRIRLRQSTQD